MTISPKNIQVNDYKTIDPDGGDYNDLTSDLTSLHQTFETVFNPWNNRTHMGRSRGMEQCTKTS